MAEKLKMALVGCGAIAKFHLDGIKAHVTGIQVPATVDRDLETLMKDKHPKSLRET